MNGKYALVTGASSGIGYQYARLLAERGYGIIAVSNAGQELGDMVLELRRDFKVDVVPLVMDLGREDSAREVYGFCKESAFDVEVLVNNAGVYHDRDFIEDSEGFNSMILTLHVHTPAMLAYYFAKEMVAAGRGYILNMSSVTSSFSLQRMSTYASTKAFLARFSRALHIELEGRGVIVTCVRPGAVATSLYSISPRKLRVGLALGYIVTPESLARRGLSAMFAGKAQITPGLSTKILQTAVSVIPFCVFRLVRKWGLF